ncbi:hypothetical protein EF847_03550 [Actinobacteria bacterium YIM 96077]|nr:hypothetical protein EF847_03550 [Actinobacteria bacterium YIM 96077]
MGAESNQRVDVMSNLLGGIRSLIDQPAGALRADAGAVRWVSSPRTAVSWSPTPLPQNLPQDGFDVAARHDAFSLVVDGLQARLHGGISGAVPVYVELDGAPGDGVHFCSRADPLIRTRTRTVRPDWDAWAHILAAGGPLEGRTTVDGIRRLLPWERITMDGSGATTITSEGWPWLDVEISGNAGVDPVRDALAEAVGQLGALGEVSTLLSGGWDSRVLAALGARVTTVPVTAWTTSSDTGTVLEELVAAKVAETLGIEHKLVHPRRDQFGQDLDHFVRSVDYQTSFHVWLVPLARRLVGTSAAVMDGLGGGLFVGGAFPDDESDVPVLDQRFGRMARYLHGAEQILDPRVVHEIRHRTRESFDSIAKPLVDHPFASTFTAYLTRTLPGISLAPYGLVSAAAPVATPFVSDAVVRAALAIPPAQHAEGQLYPELLRPWTPELVELPTAAEQTPRIRRHQRRVSSPEAAAHFRELLLTEPVRQLLARELVDADLDTWMRHLDNTRSQHLIRSLATLALWLRRYAHVLGDVNVDGLLGRA